MFSTKNTAYNLSLINSLVIKSTTIARSMNRRLSAVGIYIDNENEADYPYYKNLAGQPHAANTDIIITTIETLERVKLTQENLDKYPITRNELLKFGEFYSNLVKEYIGQTAYIKGILSPIPMEKILSARDGEILWYAPKMLEFNEYTLMHELNITSMNFIDRWDIPEYAEFEDLYAPALYSSLITTLFTRLQNLRLRNVSVAELKKSYAEATLDSYMELGRYTRNINRGSRLWLAKNIKYLTHNVGKKNILPILEKELLKPNNIDIRELKIIPSSPTNLNELSPTKSSDERDNNVLFLLDKNNRKISISIDEVKNKSLVIDSLDQDFNTLSRRHYLLSERLKDVTIETSTKFYQFHRSSTLSSSIYNKNYIFLEAIMRYLFTDLRDSLIDLTLDNGNTLSVTGNKLLYFILYSTHKIVGYKDDDYIFNKSTGTISIPQNSLFKIDFDSNAIAASNSTKLDIVVDMLNRVKIAITNPISLEDFVNKTLKAHAITTSCISYLEGPIQKSQAFISVECIKADPIELGNAMKLIDALNISELGLILGKDYKKSLNLIISSLLKDIISESGKIDELVSDLINIVKSLTSYTITPLELDNSTNTDLEPFIPLGELIGETIVGSLVADIRCGVVSSIIEDLKADDDIVEITSVNDSTLYSYNVDKAGASIFMRIDDGEGITVERPTLLASNYKQID